MKHIFTRMLLAAGAALMLGSCTIDEDDRFIELPSITAERSVILMDFTGQMCVNCPEAHELIEQLEQQYGSHLIPVSIHGGGMAWSVNITNFERNRVGLMIEEGNELNDAFGINSWPMGVVDRINDGNAPMLMSQWPAAVRDAIAQPTDVHISASVKLDGDNINITTDVMSSSDRNAALQVWLVENGIVATQLTRNGNNPDYVHNNVLRYQAYDLNGSPLQLTKGVTSSTTTDVKTRWTDKERWVVDNLSVVAFVFEGKQILNAVKVPVVAKDDSNENN